MFPAEEICVGILLPAADRGFRYKIVIVAGTARGVELILSTCSVTGLG